MTVGTMYEGGVIRLLGGASEAMTWVTGDTNKYAALSKVTGGTYTPAPQTEVSYVTIATAMEVANGGGYATYGKVIAPITPTAVTDTDRYIMCDSSDPAAWTASTFDTAGCCIYDKIQYSTTKPLVCWLYFGGTKSVTAGTLTVVFDTNGVYRAKVIEA